MTVVGYLVGALNSENNPLSCNRKVLSVAYVTTLGGCVVIDSEETLEIRYKKLLLSSLRFLLLPDSNLPMSIRITSREKNKKYIVYHFENKVKILFSEQSLNGQITVSWQTAMAAIASTKYLLYLS